MYRKRWNFNDCGTLDLDENGATRRTNEVKHLGIINAIRTRLHRKPENLTTAQTLNGDTRAYTVWHGASWDNDTYRAAVDAIARNAAKLKGRHVITSDGRRTAGNPTITRLLETAPNPVMSAYDFLYRLTADLYLNGNAFALVDRDARGNVSGFYPITASGVEWLTDESGRIYVRFRFRSGKTAIFDYSNVIHVRRHFAGVDELMGDNDSAIRGTLELAETQNRGAVEAIKSGAQLRGILKFTSIQSPEMLKKSRDEFVESYMSMANNGGIVVTDAKQDYVPIESKPAQIDPAQSEAVAQRIYAYLGISKEIVTSSYTEDQWSAFYESVLEPLCVAYSQAFTVKVFTARERAYGNEIAFDGGRMIFANNATKLNMIKELTPLGLLTVNEAREILNLSPVPDGDTRLQSLNYVDASKANQYQLGKDDTDSEVKA